MNILLKKLIDKGILLKVNDGKLKVFSSNGNADPLLINEINNKKDVLIHFILSNSHTNHENIFQLSIPNVSESVVKDNFFDLSGNSNKAMKLQSKINKQLDFKIKMQDIYNYPTIKTLALNLNTSSDILTLSKGTSETNKSYLFYPSCIRKFYYV